MNASKRFLLILGVISLVVWIVASLLLGPTGLSSEYLAEYGDPHEEYLEIIKSYEYKRYQQRPHLNGPEQPHVPEELADQIAFVEEYEARPEYQDEVHRMELYEGFFNAFNSLLLVIIIWRFARKPLLEYLDGGIEKLRQRIESVSEKRRKAELQLLEVKDKLSHLDEERSKVQAQTEHRINSELEALEELNLQSLTTLDLEYTDRKQHEYAVAAMQVKREIVNEAIAELEKQFRNKLNESRQAESLQQFMDDLERKAT